MKIKVFCEFCYAYMTGTKDPHGLIPPLPFVWSEQEQCIVRNELIPKTAWKEANKDQVSVTCNCGQTLTYKD